MSEIVSQRETSVARGLSIVDAEAPAQIEEIRELFLEYAKSLGFSLCFQNFDKELADLPGDYTRPDGRLLLAKFDNELAGCVALHKFETGICEECWNTIKEHYPELFPKPVT